MVYEDISHRGGLGWKVGSPCISPGCVNPSRSNGMCTKHYARSRKTSDGILSGNTPKLTSEQVLAIRKRSSQFATQRQIALEFHVSPDTIQRVLRGNYTPRMDPEQGTV